MIKLPDEIAAYFLEMPVIPRPAQRINPLSKSDSVEMHRMYADFDPIVRDLGLFPLDDANDSNPYCYVSKTPMAGAIFHYCHDGDRRFTHQSINSWVAAMNGINDNQGIDDLVLEPEAVKARSTAELSYFVMSTFDEVSGLCDEITVHLVQGLDASCRNNLEKMANAKDFFLREAVAECISSKPDPSLKEIAEKLSRDDYPQVVTPARSGLAAINRIIYGA